MKLLIVGGTRGTGRALTEQALEAEHDVTLLARDASAVATRHPRLTVVEGDVLDAATVEQVVDGHDAVIACLGAPALRRTEVRARGNANLVRAMEAAGVTRLVSLSVLGAAESRKSLPFVLRALVFPLYLRWAVADHEAQEDIVRASTLDWTLVRPPTLTDEAPSKRYKHGFDNFEGLSLTVGRADVAAFMLDEVASRRYVHQAPGISN